MIPLVYGYSSLRNHGVWLDFHFDDAQRLELLLTLLQTGLGVMLLAKMEFDWLDASAIFVLWLAQVLRPGRKSTNLNSRHPVSSYAVFCLEKKKMERAYCTRALAHHYRDPAGLVA